MRRNSGGPLQGARPKGSAHHGAELHLLLRVRVAEGAARGARVQAEHRGEHGDSVVPCDADPCADPWGQPESVGSLIAPLRRSADAPRLTVCDITSLTSLPHTTQQSTAQHSTSQHVTAAHSTPQHSSALHSAPQHTTAPHSTAQHSTAHRASL